MTYVALWKAWSESEALVQLIGEDASEAFLKFVNEDYLDIIAKTCDEAVGENVLHAFHTFFLKRMDPRVKDRSGYWYSNKLQRNKAAQ